MSGESEALKGGKGGDDLSKIQGDNHAHEQHDPFGDVRAAGGADRIAKAGDTNDSALDKEAANPVEGFAASSTRFSEKLATADPAALELAKPGLKDLSEMYVQSAEKEFGKGAAEFVKDVNAKMLSGQQVTLPAEANLGK
jgi:hypothetical protein